LVGLEAGKRSYDNQWPTIPNLKKNFELFFSF